MRLIRIKNSLFKKAKSTGNCRKYKIHRNRTLTELHAAKRASFCKLNPRDSKSFCKAVKFLSKKVQSIPTLVQGETTLQQALTMRRPTLLNSFFHSCFDISHPPIEICSLQDFECSEEHLCTEEEVFDLLASLDTT